jgi:hypothetical protein
MYEALLDPKLSVGIRAWVVGEVAKDRGPQATAALVRVLDDPEASLVLSTLYALADRREDAGVREALELHRSHSDPKVASRVRVLLDTPSGSTAREQIWPREPLRNQLPQPSMGGASSPKLPGNSTR